MRSGSVVRGLRRQTTDGHVRRPAASDFAPRAGRKCSVVFNFGRVRLRSSVRNPPGITREQTGPESRPERIRTRITVGFKRALTVLPRGLRICVHTGLADWRRFVPAQLHFAAEVRPRFQPETNTGLRPVIPEDKIPECERSAA